MSKEIKCIYCGETRIDFLQCSFRCYRCYAVEEGQCSSNLFQSTFEKSNQKLEQKEAYVLAHSWKFDRSVIIHGPVGTGKSFLSQCMLNMAFDNRIKIRELNSESFKKYWGVGYEQGEDYRVLSHTGCLLIDDVDKALYHENAVRVFLNIMSVRHRKKWPTIITSNFSYEGLQAYLETIVPNNISIAAAILDRFKPKPLVIELKGKSLR